MFDSPGYAGIFMGNPPHDEIFDEENDKENDKKQDNNNGKNNRSCSFLFVVFIIIISIGLVLASR